MTTISLRFDDETKAQLDEMCGEMGMNLTTFFTIYAKKALRDRRIPFEITADADPFYSESNIRHLERIAADIEAGRAHFAEHELIED